ncbi:unnamed protein product [Trichogramma brassicae]|uniref:Uncharacterized protein n=1 Tax=Trichogramma brassicae TaxID=86971 RepID=A0A6H5IXZ2_9HYME|nr:unnamed protein product [Trichogramma brassicae]
MNPSTGGGRRSPLSADSVCEREDSLRGRGDGPWRALASPISPLRGADCALPSRTASAAAGSPSAMRSTGTCGADNTGQSPSTLPPSGATVPEHWSACVGRKRPIGETVYASSVVARNSRTMLPTSLPAYHRWPY